MNHIDDTDETFGYWEPLHYLLEGRGMQTWEYSPVYAIRTYAFLLPVWLVARGMQFVSGSSSTIFKLIRLSFGSVAAFVQADFIDSVGKYFGSRTAKFTFFFLFFSSGCFYSATSFLPSAVCNILVMLTVSAWLRKRFMHCIIFGGFAVLWTGWPFVGLIFLPFGLEILWRTNCRHGLIAALRFCLASALVVLCMGLLALAIDVLMYGIITCPTWNIFLYNRGPVIQYESYRGYTHRSFIRKY